MPWCPNCKKENVEGKTICNDCQTELTSSLLDDNESDETQDFSHKIKNMKSSTYVKKEDKYKDLSSTALTFLIFSIGGITLLILNAVDIINIIGGTLSYIIMGALFLSFMYIGITTLMKSQKIKSQISDENSLTDDINKWLDQNVTYELLESITIKEDTKEIQFFQKLEKMKELIIKTFGEIDEAYLDQLVEEYYNNNFETME